MLDFSWSEFLVVILVAVIAIGPKQLPEVLHGLGRIVRRLQYMRYALGRQFDDFMNEADLKDLRDGPRVITPDAMTTSDDESEADEAVAMMLPQPQIKDDDDKSGT